VPREVIRQAIRTIRAFDGLPAPAGVRARVNDADVLLRQAECINTTPLVVRLLSRALIRRAGGDMDRAIAIITNASSNGQYTAID
jgi:hypothetical protein